MGKLLPSQNRLVAIPNGNQCLTKLIYQQTINGRLLNTQGCQFCFGARFGLFIGMQYFGIGLFRHTVSGLLLQAKQFHNIV